MAALTTILSYHTSPNPNSSTNPAAMDNAVLLLDSPLRALSLDYLSYGVVTVVVNNLWALVALLTAAVSFWKITAANSLKSIPPPQPLKQEAAVAAEEPPAEAASVSPEVREEENDVGFAVGTKGRFSKFVMRYSCEEVEGEREMITCSGGGWSWERTRVGDMEWYRCQDMGILSGNVVRLWDCDC